MIGEDREGDDWLLEGVLIALGVVKEDIVEERCFSGLRWLSVVRVFSGILVIMLVVADTEDDTVDDTGAAAFNKVRNRSTVWIIEITIQHQNNNKKIDLFDPNIVEYYSRKLETKQTNHHGYLPGLILKVGPIMYGFPFSG